MRRLRIALLALAVTAVAVPLVLAVVLVVAWDQIERHPEWVARGTEWALEWPEGAIELEKLDVTWTRWRLELGGLEVHSPKARAPDVWIGSGRCSLPNPWEVYEDRVLDLGAVWISGLEIAARSQQPQAPLKPPKDRPVTLRGSVVTLTDASFSAPDDPPMKPVHAGPIAASFTGVQWTPALRLIEGRGIAHVTELKLGAIELSELAMPWVQLEGDRLEFRGSTFDYGSTHGMAWGRITDIDTRTAVEIDVMVEGARIEHAVVTALGNKSPVEGDLTLNLTLRAGGDLPRGAARFSGWLKLSNAQFFLGKDLKLIPRLLVDIAPWFQREDGGWLEVGELQGQASFGRGWVEIVRLERPSRKHRILQAWGSLVRRDIDLVVRVVPRKKKQKKGIGLSVRGSTDAGVRLRLAKKKDLADAPEIFSR